jgi:glucan biosynthesis protein C
MIGRYHYLDAARGILMILGIVYHAARVYGEAGWLVSNDVTSPVFDGIAHALHIFRMPAFFLMSGFFAALTLDRYGAGDFLRKRMTRVVLPFVTTLLTLNVAQLYLLRSVRGANPGGLEAIVTGSLWAGVPIDAWVSHLWFLVCLAYYFLATALAASLLGVRGRATVRAAGSATRLASQPWACLLLLPLVNMAVLVVFSLFPGLYSLRPLINLDTVASYAPFFGTGLVMFASRRVYDALTRLSPGALAVTAAPLLIQLGVPIVPDGDGARMVTAYGVFLGNWVAVYWALVAFRALLDRPSRLVAGLADAAYTIYLFHHLAVIVLAWWLRSQDLGIWVKFPLLIGVTFALTLALHLLVMRRVPLVRLLFNGYRPGGRPAGVMSLRAGAA